MLARSKLLLRAALLGSLAAFATTASAQLKADPSMWTTGRDGSVKLRADEVIDLHTTDSSAKPIDPYAYKRGLMSSLGLYEYKRPGEVPGQYSKPHYALGLHSDTMREALSLTGLDAESCVAPMVRMRARETSVTGASGISMTLLARCTVR
jgi:hypothetical protein